MINTREKKMEQARYDLKQERMKNNENTKFRDHLRLCEGST
jgi:hypothetical protein